MNTRADRNPYPFHAARPVVRVVVPARRVTTPTRRYDATVIVAIVCAVAVAVAWIV